MPHPRVVSLAPGATEVLGLLAGPAVLRELLVGSWRGAHDLPEALASLRPDIVLTQATGDEDSDRAVRVAVASLPPSVRVLELRATTFEGVLDDVLVVGEAVGLAGAARAAVVALRERMHVAAEHINAFDEGPSLVFLDSTVPLRCAGRWIAQLIERAGARHVLNPCVARPGTGTATGSQQGERIAGSARGLTPEQLASADPERLIVCVPGLSLADARAAVGALSREPWWAGLRAVRSGHVALVDGRAMFHLPSPRLADGFEWLVSWLHDRPALSPPGFPWESLGVSPVPAPQSVAPQAPLR